MKFIHKKSIAAPVYIYGLDIGKLKIRLEVSTHMFSFAIYNILWIKFGYGVDLARYSHKDYLEAIIKWFPNHGFSFIKEFNCIHGYGVRSFQ